MAASSKGNPICRGLVVAAFLGLLVLARNPTGAAEGMTFKRTDTARAIAYQDIERILPESSVVATLADGAQLAFYGIDLAARSDSTVFLALSSEFLVAASLAGTIEAGSESAAAGQVLLQHMDGGSTASFYFDVERFLATSPLAFDPDIRSSLEAVSQSHKRLKFWGLLRPTGINARAPGSPVAEQVRRAYLLAPVVIRVRREAGDDPVIRARLVAEHFVAGIVENDRERVRSLMDPRLFQDLDRSYGRDAWQMLRTRYAEALIDGPLPTRLSNFQIEATDDQSQFVVLAPNGAYRLSLTELDGMYFVHRFEPDQEKAAAAEPRD